MLHINKFIVILLLYFSAFAFPSLSLAKTDMKLEQQLLLDFEDKISDLVISSVKPLDNLDKMRGKLSEEELYNLALDVGKNFAVNSKALIQLQVPNALSYDIKVSLETVKNDLSIGFTELEKSMICFARYIANHDPTFYDEYVNKRNKGIRYIDGGLNSLSTVGLQLNVSESSLIDIKKAWKKYLDKLERVGSMMR